MKGSRRFWCVWGLLAWVIAGCSSTTTVKPTSGATDSARGAATASEPARVVFRRGADGLPMDGRWKSVPLLADVNADRRVDLAIHPRLALGARVWLGNGQGGWTETSQGLEMQDSCGGGLQFGDVNKDGKVDLIVADHCSGVQVYLGDGTGRWQMVTKDLNSEASRRREIEQPDDNPLSGAEGVAVGDVNGDGFLDLVAAASSQGGFATYLGDGTGKNWKEVNDSGLPSADNPLTTAFRGGWAMDVYLVDINRDGCLDVASSYYVGPKVWLGNCKGHFVEGSEGLTKTSLIGVYRKVAVGDLNGDGRLDLVVANTINGAEAFLQNADGSWNGPLDVMPELKGGATAVAVGDLDGDGNLDVVIGGAMSTDRRSYDPWGLFVRLGNGKGGFVSENSAKLPDKGLEVIWGVALGDMSGDGRLDIAVSTGGASGKSMGPAANPPCRQLKPGEKGERLYKEGVSGVDGGLEGSGACLPRIQVWVNEGPGPR